MLIDVTVLLALLYIGEDGTDASVQCPCILLRSTMLGDVLALCSVLGMRLVSQTIPPNMDCLFRLMHDTDASRVCFRSKG
jgi:hypothetical protein